MRRFDRLFDDSGKYLDRFGPLLALTVLSVTVNSLVDLEDPTANVGTEVLWVIVSIITGLTLILALEAGGVAKGARRVAVIVVIAAVLGAIVISLFANSGQVTDSASRPSWLWVVLALVSPILVTRRLFLQDRVTVETIWGALAVFLLIALAFNYAFLGVDQASDGGFFGTPEPTTSFMYFSLVTITTLGYGDLNPVTDWARYLSTTEAVLGTIFLVTVVARLIGLFGMDPSPSLDSKGERVSPPED